MTQFLTKTSFEASILDVPQQLLLGETASSEVTYKLGRACTAHCMAAAQEIMRPEEQTNITELVDFVMTEGAETGSELYHDGRGWDIVGLSDLLRLKGHPVVSQNLKYTNRDFNVYAAAERGRARSEREKTHLVLMADYGGLERRRWAGALNHTLQLGGLVLSSIQIPLLSGDGYGMHSVLVTDIDEASDTLDYFDPDYYNLARYGGSPPDIARLDDERLLYQRPIEDHLGSMTGEVVHVLPRT
jgi:hypothetical protein